MGRKETAKAACRGHLCQKTHTGWWKKTCLEFCSICSPAAGSLKVGMSKEHNNDLKFKGKTEEKGLV